MITNKALLLERPHPNDLGGVQRLYKLGNGYGISLVNSPMLHSYPFAWEAAVVSNIQDNGEFDSLSYDTPLTSDVEVFKNDDDANAFIERAIEWGKE